MQTLQRVWSAVVLAIALAVAGFIVFSLFQAGAFEDFTSGRTVERFPDPVVGQRVYDTGDIWSDSTEAYAQSIADAIEERTGVQLAIWSEITPGSLELDEVKARAAALGNQWGVGYEGLENGYVVFFAIEPNRLHGDIALVGGSGFQNAFIPDHESTAIFEETMLPYLEGGRADYDGALQAGLGRIDGLVTPERAAELERSRQLNALLGIIGGPLLFLLLAGAAVSAWLRYGRDPVYLDDPSIHMPAPPPELTAAAGAAVWEGKVTRRALTAALLDLASRGLIGFVERSGFLSKDVGLLSGGIAPRDELQAAHQARNGRRPISDAERYALTQLRTIGLAIDGDDDTMPGELGKTELGTFGTKTKEFNERLEQHIVRQGWFREPPSAASGRWATRGVAELIAGGVLIFLGFDIPMSGLTVVGGAILTAGLVTLALAPLMPAVTSAGSVIKAMLAAYRRTLEKTMAQARSMQQVVDEVELEWLDTPDRATVWAVALGLGDSVEKVLERSAEDVKTGRADASTTWLPSWYATSSGNSLSPVGSGSGGSMFSGSGVPAFGSMVAAIGTIGAAPSSSGGSGGSYGGGGGFSGGGGGSF
jgi:uncharacterized membrane protein YgcG